MVKHIVLTMELVVGIALASVLMVSLENIVKMFYVS